MVKLPALSPRKACQALERAGFLFVRQSGSHRLYVKDNFRVTVPYHGKDLKPKTARAIIKQSGFTEQEFLGLL